MEYRCILTLGSNSEAERHIAEVLAELPMLFVRLRLSPVVETSPIGLSPLAAPFLNCVLEGYTPLSRSLLFSQLRALEERCGRTKASRHLCPDRVEMDIDLIVWDQEILKPQDFSRPYLIEGLEALGIDPVLLCRGEKPME